MRFDIENSLHEWKNSFLFLRKKSKIILLNSWPSAMSTKMDFGDEIMADYLKH